MELLYFAKVLWWFLLLDMNNLIYNQSLIVVCKHGSSHFALWTYISQNSNTWIKDYYLTCSVMHICTFRESTGRLFQATGVWFNSVRDRTTGTIWFSVFTLSFFQSDSRMQREVFGRRSQEELCRCQIRPTHNLSFLLGKAVQKIELTLQYYCCLDN